MIDLRLRPTICALKKKSGAFDLTRLRFLKEKKFSCATLGGV